MKLLTVPELINILSKKYPETERASVLRTVMALAAQIKKLRTEKRKMLNATQDLLKLIDDTARQTLELRDRMEVQQKSGLPNHFRMEQDLDRFFSRRVGDQKRRSGVILLAKLDKYFEAVQKTIKPQLSDWILFQIGQRIKNMFDGQRVYHLSENEFLIMLEGRFSEKDAEKVARALYRDIAQAHVFSGYNVHIGCHVGVCQFPLDGYNRGVLLQNADIALQSAVESESPIVLFHESMRVRVIERMDLQNSIIRALEAQSIKEIDKQFHVYYQPILELELRDRKILVKQVCAEALIRWKHPNLGLVNPSMFIPLAEETGLIVPIGKWVLYHVAGRLKAWKQQSSRLSSISVNISPRQFRAEDVLENMRNIVTKFKLPPGSLRLELTESSLIEEPFRIIKLMEDLHDLGVNFSIDDFGTGYSSLSYVHKLPVGHLKIDQTFVQTIDRDPRTAVIIRTIIAMANELGFGIIAEGIETQAQFEFLYTEGVRFFQGFLFSRPLTASQFEAFLRSIEGGVFAGGASEVRSEPDGSDAGEDQLQDDESEPDEVDVDELPG